MKFVQLDNGVVTGHLEADQKPEKLPAGRTFVEVGDTPPPFFSKYKPNAHADKTAPADAACFDAPPPPPDLGAAVDPRTFLFLFTSDERKAIRRAAKTDEDVDDFMTIASVPMPIRLKHPNTVAGFAMLVAKNLLTQQRANAIMNSTPAQ